MVEIKQNKGTIFKFIIIPLVIAALCIAYFFYIYTPKEQQFFSMDTLVTITANKNNTEKYKDIVNGLSNEFDMYNENSTVYKINQKSQSDSITENVADIIRESIDLSDKYGKTVDITSGALTKLWGISTDNPTVPSDQDIKKAVSSIDIDKVKVTDTSVILPQGAKFDLGSVAKGYACDVIKKEFINDSVTYGIISMGSSSLLFGNKLDGSRFTVEIKNPDGGESLGVITTDETFVSTSGGYERFFEADGKKYSHILDLSTGYPSDTDITSVTVLCDSGIKSDFLSTQIYLDGTEHLKEHLQAPDYSIVVATADHKVYWSENLDFYFNKDSGFTKGE